MWLQAHLTVDKSSAPLIALLFEDLGALAVTFDDAGHEPMLEPGPGETPLWQATRVSGLFGGDTDPDDLRSQVSRALAGDANLDLTLEPLADRDWERAWMDRFKPMRFGRRLWIRPSGSAIAEPDAVVIDLDPGLAFGTGTHPTTALCLEWLDGQDLAGKQVIDFGCGSGVLAIAALKLGAHHATAVDHDPQAVLATRDNAERNRVGDRISVVHSTDFAPQAVDLVMPVIVRHPARAGRRGHAGLCWPHGFRPDREQRGLGITGRHETPLITRCPKCETRYDVEPDALLRVDGRALCFRCGSLFDALAEEPLETDARDGTATRPIVILNKRSLAPGERATEPEALPFEIPDDLQPLQPTADSALDITETLREKKSSPGIGYGAIAVLLTLAIGLQLFWQYRSELLQRYPALRTLCSYVECQTDTVRAPEKFRILRRDIRPTENEPGSLTLSARVRNDAQLAQAFPDLQLSLLDNKGSVMIRRRLSPDDYMFPSPPQTGRVAPGEVFTIELDFEDPGYLVTSFVVDFL
jgi:ribosomal protein L11 methyltransferase